MKIFIDGLRRMPFQRTAIFASAAILASLACNLSPSSTSTPTPSKGAMPAGWACYTDATYGFEVCYPPDATITSSSPEHARISLTVAPGTNLMEKWMDVDAGSGLATCESPQAQGYEPGSIHTEIRVIGDLKFVVESASQGAAGNFYNWIGYSIQKGSVCVVLSGVVHTTDALNYPTPPPTVDPAAEGVVFDQIVATFRWLDTTPTPAVTATVPSDWPCYTNAAYAFEVCYPADATLSDETPAHVRIHLTIVAGTNLIEKWMDVDGSSGPAACESPQAAGYDPAAITASHRTIAGLDFLVQSASEGAAGNIYQWTGYSTQRTGVCASLTGVLHSGQPGNYSTPPPLFDPAAESAVFDQIAGTFRWLAAPTATSTPTPTAAVPADWPCYTNAAYAFEVCYPADATLSDETPAHVRIHLTIAAGTNLIEKWMDVDGSHVPPACQSPQAAGYDPSAIESAPRTIAGLDFLVQKASEGAAGNLYQWIGFSTQRADVCASLTGVLHSTNPAMYTTPPVLFNQPAETAVFDQIAATFHWLAAPAATFTPTPAQLQFIDPWISVDRFYYHGATCGPAQVQFQIRVTRPELVHSVGIFFQLKDKGTGKISAWSQGYAMAPIGGGKYFFTLTLDNLPDFASMEIKEAWLQYQFVANDGNGTPLLHSDVFANVTLAYCAVVKPGGK